MIPRAYVVAWEVGAQYDAAKAAAIDVVPASGPRYIPIQITWWRGSCRPVLKTSFFPPEVGAELAVYFCCLHMRVLTVGDAVLTPGRGRVSLPHEIIRANRRWHRRNDCGRPVFADFWTGICGCIKHRDPIRPLNWDVGASYDIFRCSTKCARVISEAMTLYSHSRWRQHYTSAQPILILHA